MIRRADQIAVSVFMQETAALGVTPTQYGILHLLHHQPDTDQVTVARLLGLDRSTTSMVVKAIENAGLVDRVVEDADRRRRSLRLTQAGEDLLASLQTPAARAVERLMSPLDPAERTVFLRLVEKLIVALNNPSRVPIAGGR